MRGLRLVISTDGGKVKVRVGGKRGRRNQSSQMRLSPRSTLADVLDAPARLETDLDRHLTALTQGLRLLFGPHDVAPPRLCDGELLDRLVHALADRAEYVLVDLPTAMSESSSRLVRHLDHIVVVVEAYRSCAQPARQLVERLRGWGLANARLSALVVHRELAPGREPLRAGELCDALGIALAGEVPPAGDACELCNQRGVPLVTACESHPAATAIGALARELIAEVEQLRLRVAVVTRREDVALRLRGLLDDADPERYDVTRAPDLDDILMDLIDGSFDALLMVRDDGGARPEQDVARAVSLAERTAVLTVTADGASSPECAGICLGAQDELPLAHMNAYWLSHSIRYAVERRRLQARLERELRAMVACDTDMRRLVAHLLRETHPDPRMV